MGPESWLPTESNKKVTSFGCQSPPNVKIRNNKLMHHLRKRTKDINKNLSLNLKEEEEMIERLSSIDSEVSDIFTEQFPFLRNTGIRKRISNSTTYIPQRALSSLRLSIASPSLLEMPLPRPSTTTYIAKTAKNSSPNSDLAFSLKSNNTSQRFQIHRKKVKPKEDFLSKCPRLYNAHSSPSLYDIKHLKDKFEAESFPNESTQNNICDPFLLPNDEVTEAHIKIFKEKLNSFENGHLPHIPEEYCPYFSEFQLQKQIESLNRFYVHQCNPISTPNSVNFRDSAESIKFQNQQREAIIEFFETEAHYLQVLHLIIRVHVAVFLELQKINFPSQTNFKSYSISRSSNPETVSVRQRRRNIIFEKLRLSKYRQHSMADVSNIDQTPTPLTNSQLNIKGSLLSIQSTQSIDDVFTTSQPTHEQLNVFDIFGNIGEVLAANQRLWVELEPCLINYPEIDTHLCLRHMKSVFSKFEQVFEPYVEFLKNCNNQIEQIKYLETRSRLFLIYNEWTTHTNYLHLRENLANLLRKPFQRLTRYGLLLKRIKEETENEQEIVDINFMLAKTNKFVKMIDSIIPDQQSVINLENFLRRIDYYQFTDLIPEDFKGCCSDTLETVKANLRKPTELGGKARCRTPIFECPAKIKYRVGRTFEGICILLTDLLLICKPIRKGDKLKLIQPPISVKNFTMKQISGNLGCYFGIVKNELNCQIDFYIFTGEPKLLDKLFYEVMQAQKIITNLLNLSTSITSQKSTQSVPTHVNFEFCSDYDKGSSNKDFALSKQLSQLSIDNTSDTKCGYSISIRPTTKYLSSYPCPHNPVFSSDDTQAQNSNSSFEGKNSSGNESIRSFFPYVQPLLPKTQNVDSSETMLF